MHDRRIDGVIHTFGNAGSLVMNAMTWYDHETESIWSQPWGRAIEGEYKGVQLNLLPFQLTTWERWKEAYPHTLVMINDLDRMSESRRQGFQADFVIGLVLVEESKAYYYTDVEKLGVVNDTLANTPIMVWAADEIYQAYLRQIDGQTLTFSFNGEELIDKETGSRWDPALGLALSGPLEGKSLKPVPSLSSYDWAWKDFYPESDFYKP
ncbi:MAG: DUF3179 domain-containing protein [Anaerolineae bacterium]|nr:DUF3179 domain-containing protein [Anaerolineae bacterium]MBT4312543.1 DUF3179 domain-containing protein [Anaerolineae bacterium]MBT4457666.1 DUF3179 domain-containing protein [Anaerolineae bacterium]MBT4841161.1 DUF3179 domain-containing protein [Anaerolineae bacterium]MBT6062352.1 DUF3179 domain-containing protein [Anaerolineae bacterium]